MKNLFYILTDSGCSAFDFAVGNDWEPILCPVYEGHQRAGKRTTVLIVKQTRKKLVDFSWTFLSDIIISYKVYAALAANGITGFSVRDIRIIESNYPPTEKFYELVPTGKGGRAHKSSAIETIVECEHCGLTQYSSSFKNGLIVDEKHWDKADVFTIHEYPKIVLVTHKVKKVIEEMGFSNVSFINSHKLK